MHQYTNIRRSARAGPNEGISDPRRSRDLTHVRSEVLTLVVRTDEQAAGEAGVRLSLAVGRACRRSGWWRTKAERQALSRPSAAGGGGRRPALTGPGARPSSSTEVDCGRSLGRGPVEQLHQGVSAA